MTNTINKGICTLPTPLIRKFANDQQMTSKSTNTLPAPLVIYCNKKL